MKNTLKDFLKNLNDMFFSETGFKDLSIAFLRIFFGTSILIHGLYKASDLFFFSHLIDYMGHPIAGFLAPVLAYGQILIGFFLILGLFTKISALITNYATFYTMLFIYHIEPLYNRELAISYFFISLLFLFWGGTKYSLDNKLHDYFNYSLKKSHHLHL